MRRSCSTLAILTAILATHAEFVDAAKQSSKTNLVAIVTDDQGRWAMGAYGNREVKTPNMDRIGREGATFTNAFVNTPVCSPSRATYFSGRYPTELGITDWIAPNQAAEGLGLDAPTWPQVLQKHGYKTGLVGKWHLGDRPKFHPTKLGFHHFMGFLGGGNRPIDPTLEVDGKEQKLKGPLPDILTDDAIRFVESNRDQPFALCLHYRAPHTPYLPVPPEDSKPFDDLDPQIPHVRGLVEKQIKQQHRAYYSSIHSVDRNIGRLLDRLDELKLTENTLVIFTSDHGYNLGRHGVSTKGNGHWMAGGVNGPKRPNMWDTSVRVPLVVRWPGVIEPGGTIDDHVAAVDMYRSVLGALKVPIPENVPVHGVDWSPLLRGEKLPPRGPVFGQYDLHNSGLAYLRMIRTPQYKYIKHFRADFMDELYDLEADPGETRNLLGRRSRSAHAETAKKLGKQLNAWQQSINDPILKTAY